MNLLEDIQNSVIDQSKGLSEILLKCKLLAARIDSADLENWLLWESNGYPIDAELPDYRKVPMSLKGNFIAGLYQMNNHTIPIEQLPELYRENFRYRDFRESISSIEQMGKSGSDGKGIIHVDAGALSLALNGKIFQHSSCLSAWGEISPIQLSEIMNSVRNRVFDFSLALWKKYPNAGEVGVADTTKKIAQAQVHQIFNTTINGGNTQVIGQATDSNLINGVVAGDVQSLKKALSELKVPNAEIEELGAILIEEPQLTPSGTYGPKLSKWVGKLVEKSADGSWKVAIGAAGGLLASALRAYFHMGP